MPSSSKTFSASVEQAASIDDYTDELHAIAAADAPDGCVGIGISNVVEGSPETLGGEGDFGEAAVPITLYIQVYCTTPDDVTHGPATQKVDIDSHMTDSQVEQAAQDAATQWCEEHYPGSESYFTVESPLYYQYPSGI